MKVTARQDREPIVDGILSGWKQGTDHISLLRVFSFQTLRLTREKKVPYSSLSSPFGLETKTQAYNRARHLVWIPRLGVVFSCLSRGSVDKMLTSLPKAGSKGIETSPAFGSENESEGTAVIFFFCAHSRLHLSPRFFLSQSQQKYS